MVQAYNPCIRWGGIRQQDHEFRSSLGYIVWGKQNKRKSERIRERQYK
jgi:hypothetical protein